MGQRSAGETIAGIYQAFLARRRWAQADLARHLGISAAALTKRLTDVSAAGMPLTSEREHPHVVWSVAATWFPGGVLLKREEAADAVRLLARAHASSQRDRLLSQLGRPSTASDEPELDEPTYLAIVEDARRKRKALHMQYFTVSRGAMEYRHVSVARIFHDPPVRFVALCHRDACLKWFRADAVLRGELAEHEAYRPIPVADVTRFVKESVDGFRDRDRPLRCAFVVRSPESRWVARNLPWPLRGQDSREGFRVEGETAGLLRVARFVVSLGDAARCETPELAILVRQLAEGALHLNAPSVPPIRKRGSTQSKP